MGERGRGVRVIGDWWRNKKGDGNGDEDGDWEWEWWYRRGES